MKASIAKSPGSSLSQPSGYRAHAAGFVSRVILTGASRLLLLAPGNDVYAGLGETVSF
ncbi:hypothetical protein JAO29_15920 [Edaphobacter sp. HDX4]|uniref:hypothetical protein n=1 Tax=Edaphobacter sp. HDX4 TaxID=2794064 RepID=UPI002FE65949